MQTNDEWHLGQTQIELKLSIISIQIFRTFEAYTNYIEGCGKVINLTNLNAHDIMILECIYSRPFQTIAQISEYLNNDDIAAILYSLKKLIKEKLIKKVTNNLANKKIVSYQTTKNGMQNIHAFTKLSQHALIPMFMNFKSLDRLQLKKYLFLTKIIYKKIFDAITIHEKILEANIKL